MSGRIGHKWVAGLADVWLRLAGRLTPPHLRERWLEEWRAEFWHRNRGSGAWRAFGDLAGAFRDAFASRKLLSDRSRPSPTTPLRSGDNMRSDIKFAVRSLMRRPGFTAVALATLAVGFGATTAMFVAVRAVVLDPLPFPEADRLVRLYERRPHQGRERNPLSLPDFVDWQAADIPSIERMAIYTFAGASLTGVERPEALDGIATGYGFFGVLGIAPALGRVFRESETGPAGSRVVILSHGIWQRIFGADPGILETTIQLNHNPYTLVGVMPEGFIYPFEADADFWMPLRDDPSEASRGSHGFDVVARLAPGASVDGAFADLDVVARRLESEYPGTNEQHYANVLPLSTVALGTAPGVLWLLLSAVGFVLLIVCTNVANMQLARGIGRQRELAIRTSLGATRGRLVVQLLTENGVLGMVGGTVGLGVAWWFTRLTEPKLLEAAPWLLRVGLDPFVASASIIVAVGVSMGFGAIPAAMCSRTRFSEALRDGARASSGAGSRRMRGALVVIEFAVALLLLVGAGLATRSFARLMAVDPGFDEQGVMAAELGLPRTTYPEPQQRLAFFDAVEERLAGTPGVESVGYTWILPFTGNEAGRNFDIEGREPPVQGDAWNARWRIADAGYFETMRIPLLAGRMFARSDHADAPPVALVSNTMARTYWPDGDAVGARFRLGTNDPWMTIVGVVGDVRHRTLDTDVNPEFYQHRLQMPNGYGVVVARTSGSAASLAPEIRSVVRDVDPDQPISSLMRMSEYLDRSVAQRRVTALVVAAFGVTALVLAAMGVYGVLSYAVGQRTHEIGVRMALGGRTADVLRLFVTDGMRIVAIGLGVGLAGAFALTRFVDAFLFGVPPTDVVSFAGAVGVLVVTALVAILGPARRAARVDPIVSFRAE